MRRWPLSLTAAGGVAYLALIAAWFLAGWTPAWPWNLLVVPIAALPAAGVAIIYYGARKTRYQGGE